MRFEGVGRRVEPGLDRSDPRIDDGTRRDAAQSHADELPESNPRTARPRGNPQPHGDQPYEENEDDDDEEKNQGQRCERHQTTFLGCIGDAHDDARPLDGHDFNFLIHVDVFAFGHHIDFFAAKAYSPDGAEGGDGGSPSSDQATAVVAKKPLRASRCMSGPGLEL